MPSGETTAQQSRALVEQVRRAQIFQDYEQAFRETTGLPINLRPIEAFDSPHRGDPKENPFCMLLASTNHSCAACLQLQRTVAEKANLEPKTLKCFAGLCDSAVPVRVGQNLIAFLQTGQVLSGIARILYSGTAAQLPVAGRSHGRPAAGFQAAAGTARAAGAIQKSNWSMLSLLKTNSFPRSILSPWISNVPRAPALKLLSPGFRVPFTSATAACTLR